jgi:signal transduction histidine kinase
MGTFTGVNPFTAAARRWRRADPFKADLALTAVFVAGMLVEAALVEPHGKSRAVTAIVGSLALLPLAWRRVHPFWAAAGFAVLALPQDFINSFFFGDTNAPFVATLLLAYSLGRHAAGREEWAGWVLVPLTVGIGIAFGPTYTGPGDLIWVFILYLPPFLAGRAIRSRVALRRELREKAERIEADREQAAQRAVDDERNRIATELQAVVANGVSAMVVQAEAVPVLLAAEDHVRAREAFEVIEETGRDALAEMRRLLGVLRREGEAPQLAPQPGIARLDTLVARLREEGMQIELIVLGEQRQLATGVDLTAYRVLQDALEGAAAAEATKAAVTLRYRLRDLELEVRDDRAAATGEGSLTALRERVTMYGGHLRGVRPEDGGYSLEARLPARPAEEPAGVPEAVS